MESSFKNKWDGKRPDPITQRKESLYDKIPLTLKQLDVIIIILAIILIAALVIGTLKGNGIL